MSRASGGHAALNNGTPGQVHLTWGGDPATSVVVSWASPGRALRPRVRIGQRVIFAQERTHVNEATGKTEWSYHARVTELRPGAIYAYAVTADNDANAADPHLSTFRTAPAGRGGFRFTCSGALAVPDYQGGAHLAGVVESFQPLFHLLNGGLCGAGPASPRAFCDGSQFSAASRPWMPVPGPDDPAALRAYLARYDVPPDGAPQSQGRWYSFRVGAVVFACLDSGDAAGGDARQVPDAQARWLEGTLTRARADASVDWIIVSAHHPSTGTQLLPLLDRCSADLLLSGHGSGYARSFPHPMRAGGGNLDTSRGTVRLTLGQEPAGGFGIAVFDVAPCTEASDEASMTVSCYQEAGLGLGGPPTDGLTPAERFTLVRPRPTGRAPAALRNAGRGPVVH
ncbi:MAG TPA: metallophosphoesterase family protein [Trebonia sp.]|nr:metallophosphoesterase family protein [Trebonia sp.]